MQFTNYLAFDNALEASEYYIKYFDAELINHINLTPEIIEQLKIEVDDITKTSFQLQIEIFGNKFSCSDRIDNTGDFSDSVNMLIQFTSEERELFDKYISLLHEAPVKQVLFSNIDEKEQAYNMYRIKDKYNLIWSLIIIND